MARVTLIRSIEEFPASTELDEAGTDALEAFFAKFLAYREAGALKADEPVADLGFQPTGERDPSKPMANWASMVNSPELAIRLMDIGGYVTSETAWTQKRPKMRELMYVALSDHLGYHSLFTFHCPFARELGITPEQLAHLSFYDVSELFNEEERFIVGYTKAVLDYVVSDELFEQGRQLYGDKEMVELTVLISYSAFKVRIYRALQAFEWQESTVPQHRLMTP